MLEEYGIPGLPDSPVIGGGLTSQGDRRLHQRSAGSRPIRSSRIRSRSIPRSTTRRSWAATSLKAGYEYQSINTDIFDFNPQYGQDSYGGQFSRPTGAAANNLYNLADFLFGARSSYSLNNEIVLNYRQRMHFFYLQDDWKVNYEADAEPRRALRVRHAAVGRPEPARQLRSGAPTR